jgi:hypothetical protein
MFLADKRSEFGAPFWHTRDTCCGPTRCLDHWDRAPASRSMSAPSTSLTSGKKVAHPWQCRNDTCGARWPKHGAMQRLPTKDVCVRPECVPSAEAC